MLGGNTITTNSNIPIPSPPPRDELSSGGSFVPPLPNSSSASIHWHGGRLLQATASAPASCDDEDEDDDEPRDVKPVIRGGAKRGSRGGGRGRKAGSSTGGRRAKKDYNVTPEEEDRRRLRRERNKMAAARCRKRRVDQTNLLEEETSQLESSKRTITSKITDLQHEKEELELILQAHVNNCSNLKLKQGRPTSLPVLTGNSAAAAALPQQQSVQQSGGPPGSTPLQTPSNGLQFDFDWAASFPSTGLTPGAVMATPSGTGMSLMTPLMTPGTVGAILGSLGKSTEEGVADTNMAVL